VRDLDVYLLDFDGYQQKLPIALRPHLGPMREFLLAHYDDEQRKLAEGLRSKEFRDLVKDWRAFLEAPVPARSAVPNATRPTKAVADERIWSMYRRVRKEGRAITADSPAEDLHEMRKSCKKLRYLIEFFASLYPKKKIGVLVKFLKGLLDNLGRFQDLAIQAAHLRELAQRMRDEGRAETDTLLAMGVLVGDLLEHQQQARVEFSEIFAEFDGKEHRALFEELFAPQKKRGGGE
jgi:CHAD domain-containing protein